MRIFKKSVVGPNQSNPIKKIVKDVTVSSLAFNFLDLYSEYIPIMTFMVSTPVADIPSNQPSSSNIIHL